MKLPRKAIAGFALAIFFSSVSAKEQSRQPTFTELLTESGLHLHPQRGFVEIPIRHNSVLAYEFALRHKSEALELRYVVRPLSRIATDYSDPHNAAPDPNHLFPLLFESISLRLSVGNLRPSSIFSEQEAQRSFNADWAAAEVLDLDPEFSSDYRYAVLIGLHKKNIADAYTLILYNNADLVKPLLNSAISSMTFAPDPD